MGCLGVHFALSEDESDALWDRYEAEDDDGVLELVQVIEERAQKSHRQETDKAWDAIHRVLSDGTLDPQKGEWPLKGAVLGGEHFYFRDDWIVVFVGDDEVKEISTALEGVTRDWFAARFATLRGKGYYGSADAEDLEYTWHWFEKMRDFYRRTAKEGRAILFSADQ